MSALIGLNKNNFNNEMLNEKKNKNLIIKNWEVINRNFNSSFSNEKNIIYSIVYNYLESFANALCISANN